MTILTTTSYNSVGLINWLQQPGQLHNRLQKSMRVTINPLIKSCCTRPDSYRDDPAAETKSIGLSNDAPLSWFLHTTLTTFSSHDKFCPVTGTMDNFIMTRNCSFSYRDYLPFNSFTVTRSFLPSTETP